MLSAAVRRRARQGSAASLLSTAVRRRARQGSAASVLSAAVRRRAREGSAASVLSAVLRRRARQGSAAFALSAAVRRRAREGSAASVLSAALRRRARQGSAAFALSAAVPARALRHPYVRRRRAREGPASVLSVAVSRRARPPYYPPPSAAGPAKARLRPAATHTRLLSPPGKRPPLSACLSRCRYVKKRNLPTGSHSRAGRGHVQPSPARHSGSTFCVVVMLWGLPQGPVAVRLWAAFVPPVRLSRKKKR